MKRIVAALSFAVIAAPVFAAEISAPFEQTQFDRVLNVQEQYQTANSSVWSNDHNFTAPAQ